MIHLTHQPDKRAFDALVDQLLAQGVGRGEFAVYLRRKAHKILEPVQAQRRAMDFRQKRAKFETGTFWSVAEYSAHLGFPNCETGLVTDKAN